MDYDFYKSLIMETAESIPKYLQEDILRTMAERGIIRGLKQNDSQDDEGLDVTQVPERARLTYSIDYKKDALKYMEEYEFKKSYKYSVLFNFKGYNREVLDELLKKNVIIAFSNRITDYDSVDTDINIPTVIFDDEENKVLLKFNLKYEGYDPDTGQKKRIKYPIIAVLFINIGVLEIRFDRLGGIFRGKDAPYSLNVCRVLDWLQFHLAIVVENIYLQDLVDDIRINADDVVETATCLSLKGGGKATLEVGSNEDDIMPLIGELKLLMIEYEKEFNESPVIKRILNEFIKETEETSDRPWISLCWKNKVKAKNITVKFAFDYAEYNGEKYCLLQHIGKQVSTGRMDYVTSYIITYRKDN